MTVLSSEHRKLLSDVVVRAREMVEVACLQRVTALGVAADKAPEILTEADRAVRVGLRARARQLGSIDALVAEAGFEHWHRMLFARFLADNGLLIDDQFGQPLTIDEVAEYAAESGETDVWEVAASFAAAMLPGIFIQNDPILTMRLPVETRQELERLLDQLPAEVITAEDSLGWVYQYWQSRRKDEVNKSERKIGGADLAPVTQLFTEHYMVRFLLENSLGAWWAARHPESPLVAEWDYMRRDNNGLPAVGGFNGWPKVVAEVKVMDPCCGSGHFLVAAFGMLWRMRAEEEGLDPGAAQDAVLRDNLFGLELDPRCTQIAMFALALQAWKDGGYRELPLPNVACCGIPARAPLSDWLALAGGNSLVEAALTRLHTLFANADTLGSLIDPVRAAEQAGLESVDWHAVSPYVQEALAAERGNHATDPAAAVFGQAAAGIARAADYLSRTYTLSVTNPPYLGLERQGVVLEQHAKNYFPEAKRELGLIMASRWLSSKEPEAWLAVVLPSDWMFTRSGRHYRSHLLREAFLHVVAHLGFGSFTTPLRVDPVLLLASSGATNQKVITLDAAQSPVSEKADFLKMAPICWKSQDEWREAQDQRILLTAGVPSKGVVAAQLSRHCDCRNGASAGDSHRFERAFWEIALIDGRWRRLNSSPSDDWADVSGCSGVILWEAEQGQIAALADSVKHLNHAAQNWRRGKPLWGRQGVIVGQIGCRITRYSGEIFDSSCFAVVPESEGHLAALVAYARSGELKQALGAIAPTWKVTSPSTILQLPFDVDRWKRIATDTWPQGLPELQTDDPKQWLFRGEVAGSRFPLQVAVARLLGYHWPDQDPDGLDALVDIDGVVCLPALGGESTAEERLRALLATAYGDSWSMQVLDALLLESGAKTGAGGLEKWLRDLFFKDHCKVFDNRPFVWQIWDGRPDGFSVLVNYHKLDRKLLERLTYDYLGSWWIARLNDEVRQQVPGADARLAAAEELKRKLKLILEGEPPFDIFVRWKSLAEQPMGWDPDLDDGVRMNIRPFIEAGVLRTKPNIKWDKDRGRNPDGTERLNDLHFTLTQKRAARGVGGS